MYKRYLKYLLFLIFVGIIVSIYYYMFVPVILRLTEIKCIDAKTIVGSEWFTMKNGDKFMYINYGVILPPIGDDYIYLISAGRPIKSISYQRYSTLELTDHYYNGMYLGNEIYGGSGIKKKIYIYTIENVPIIDKSKLDY